MTGPNDTEAEAQELFDRLVAEHMSDPGVTLGRMLRGDGLMVHGKVFAMAVRGRLVVKLPAARATAMVEAGEGTAFEPSPGRAMREWVAVEVPAPPADESAWRPLVEEARAYVAALAEKAAAKASRRRRPAAG
ncbi:MAG TPA: hypothetical protein VK306_14935 [Acidimicrobiales bacterium]|nr:hypothetical protein [Acidimicrobiales bacterium]